MNIYIEDCIINVGPKYNDPLFTIEVKCDKMQILCSTDYRSFEENRSALLAMTAVVNRLIELKDHHESL